MVLLSVKRAQVSNASRRKMAPTTAVTSKETILPRLRMIGPSLALPVDQKFPFFLLHLGAEHRVEFDRRRVLAGGDGPSQGLGHGTHVVRTSPTTDPDVVDAQRLRPPGVIGHLESRTEERLERDGKDVRSLGGFQ